MVLLLLVALGHLLLSVSAAQYMRNLAEASREPARLQAHYVSEVRLRTLPRPAPVQHAQPPQAALHKSVTTRRPAKPVAAIAAVGTVAAEAASAGASDPASALASAQTSTHEHEPAASASEPLASASEPASAAHALASPASATAAPLDDERDRAVSSALASAASSAQASDDRPFGFDWPQATRVRYKLNGMFRGPIYGQAEVEWIRQGLHYQVHVDVDAGIFARQISSDGQITERGLEPRVFLEKYRALGLGVRSRSIRFSDSEVVLAGGERLPAPPDLQDEASQFVQLTYQFVREPDRLMPGKQITLPMVRANSRRIEPYVYDVVAVEQIDTPMGRIPAAHLVPRRNPERIGKGDWVLELWFSAYLEYLPVKLLFRKDDAAEQMYGELLIERAPQRALAPAAPAS